MNVVNLQLILILKCNVKFLKYFRSDKIQSINLLTNYGVI